MAITKFTFTLDTESITHLQDAANQLGKPKSEIVREAICEFHDRLGRLSDRERARMLAVFDEVIPAIPARPLEDVEREISDIRTARRTGGRKTASHA